MKKIALALMLTALCLLFCSCSTQDYIYPGSSYTYADGEDYSAGGGNISGRVEKVDISWLDGMVNIAYHDGGEIVLSETADQELEEDTKLHWQLEGKTLYVKYAASGFRRQSGLEKQLTVQLPEDLRLEDVEIAVASAAMQADGLKADAVHIQSGSGCVALWQSGEVGEIKVDTASGSVDVAVEAAGKLVINTASGEVRVDGYQVDQMEAATASGYLSLQFAHTPDKISVDAVSGNVTIRLPKDAGFTAEISSVSGAVSGSLLMERKDDGRYVSGDGHCRIRVDTVSGDVQLSEMLR
ncbi:MAG: DUF4097 family beta strand repeat protein [Clostridia bacterium]|nr:DUF4097 family beta strand repeat protein [Clostridia bacterium]